MINFDVVTGTTMASLYEQIKDLLLNYGMELVSYSGTSLLMKQDDIYFGMHDNGQLTTSTGFRTVISLSKTGTFESNGRLTDCSNYWDDVTAREGGSNMTNIYVAFASDDEENYFYGFWKATSSTLGYTPFNFAFCNVGNQRRVICAISGGSRYVYNLDLEQVGTLAHQLSSFNIVQQDYCFIRQLNEVGVDGYIDVARQFDSVYDCTFAITQSNMCKFLIGTGIYLSMNGSAGTSKQHYLFKFEPNEE